MAPEPQSHRFTSQRLDLHYVDWGNPEAPTVILVHGGRDHARSWDRVALALRDEWHIVAPDLRGHGDSGWSSDGASSMPYLVADLARLVEVLGEVPVRIVGHSFGGAIALHYAGLFPERVTRLVAIEGLRPLSPKQVPTRDGLRAWTEARLRGREGRLVATLDEAAMRMRATNPRLTDALAAELAAHATRAVEGGYRWKFDPELGGPPGVEPLPDALVHQLWAAIACPVWLVHGADSWATDPAGDGRAAHFRDATVTSYADAAHWVHHDRADAFIADLRAFLR